MFETLTIDELKSLMAALITKNGYSSNKMSRLLTDHHVWALQLTYADIATEQGDLYSEASQTMVAKFGVAA